MAEHIDDEPKPAPRLLDLSEEQQNLATRLGSGYRVIRGVAGSGKTVILVERLKLLASQNSAGSFALFCFNRALSEALSAKLADVPQVTVSTMDSFVSDELKRRRLSVESTAGDKFQVRAELALEASLSHGGTAVKFDAVFVDEAQDLDRTRLDIAFAALKSPDGDFVVVHDSAQDIFQRTALRWTPPGRTARGRTHLMRINYRNTVEVLQHAYYFLARGRSEVSNDAEPVNPDAIAHPLASRKGPPPRTFAFDSGGDAVVAVCQQVADLVHNGAAPDRIATVAGNQKTRTKIYKQMMASNVPYIDLSFGGRYLTLHEAKDKVHGASFLKLKGLEYKHVYLLGLDDIDRIDGGDDFEQLRRLVYVAMTRSTHLLTIALHGEGEMIDELRDVQQKLDEHRSV